MIVAAEEPFEKGFEKITDENGFYTDKNNYAWGMTEFDDCIYVGTSRNVPYMVGLQMKMAGLLDWDLEIPEISHPGGEMPPIPGMTPSDYYPDPDDTVTWSEGMSGEIWQYCGGSWAHVHTAPTFEVPVEWVSNPGNPYWGQGRNYTYPEGTGYRYMITYTDTWGEEAVYAGVGLGFDQTLLWKSTDGENWCIVNFSTPVASYDTRALAVHNGDLYLGLGLAQGIGAGGVFRTDDPSCETDTWIDTNFPGGAVGAMESYNGLIYVITWGDEVTPFEVWRSTVADPLYESDWMCIVTGGAGDAWNTWGADIETFNGDLYVGSMSLPIFDGNMKGFDLIRIHADDSWELIIGDYNVPAERQTSTTGDRGQPLSGWPSGFGNPFNFYNWQLEEHDGLLYLTTFDASSFLRLISEIGDLDPGIFMDLDQSAITSSISELQNSGIDDAYTDQLLQALDQSSIEEIITMLGESLGGADMWVSSDGVHFVPVELNGLDNPNNYGFRTLLSTDDGLYVGTANPFQGLEVWVGEAQTGCSLVTTSDYRLFDVDPEQCGQQFRLIYTPDVPDNPAKYRLTASNPGQFRYNVFSIGELDAGERFTIELPYPFVTQGANPVHVYSTLKFGENKCLVPGNDITSQFTISGAPVELNVSCEYDEFGETATIDVQSDCGYSGFVWITVHADYGLKKEIGDLGKTFDNDATGTPLTIENDYGYVFEVTAPFNTKSVIENLNVFKRVPGFYGLVTENDETPVEGAEVMIFDDASGSPLGTAITDEDGYYFYNYKHKGKETTFTLSVEGYDDQTVAMKANKLVQTDFVIP